VPFVLVPTNSRNSDLQVGDLVTHALYGKEWIGIIIDFAGDEEEISSISKKKALVQTQPGTKYDGFFERKAIEKNRVHKNLGYVSIHWLFKIEVNNEDTGSSRNKAPPS